jgi:homoserine kinase type II
VAVYTDISEADLVAFLARYDIGTLKSFKGIAEGVENTNYLIKTSSDTFILTIYEKRVNAEELPFFMHLKEHLFAGGLPCPKPISAKGGETLQEINGRTAAIISFLQGKWPKQIRNAHCEEVGKYLAKMHTISASFDMQRQNTMGMGMWKQLLSETVDQADEVSRGLSAELKENMQFLEENWPKDLPSGVIHADLFPDNVFFQGDGLTGMLDFYFACNDFYAYDLAICLNAWCFEHGTAFNITKAKAMLRHYNKVRPFSDAEREALPILASGAAMRFLLSRLYDWLKPVEGALVSPKNPKEYIEKLRFHRQVKSHAEYGL